jgi:AraC family transcriptional regulator
VQTDVIAMPELRVATVSHQGPYDKISNAFARLGEVADRAGLFGPSATMLAIYHDDPGATPPAELRSEAGITIPPGARVPEGLNERRIPAGQYARTVHVGPYEQLPSVWPRLMTEGLPATGHRLRAGPNFEIYRNTPDEVPTEELVTELYVPVE